MVKVHVALTIEDLTSFNLAHWHAPFNKKTRQGHLLNTFLLTFTFLTLLILAINLSRGSNPTFGDGWYCLIASIIIAGAIYFIGVKSRIQTGVVKNFNDPNFKNSFLPNDIQISESGLETWDALTMMSLKWPAVVRAIVDKNYYYIYTNPLQAIVIPKRLLTEEEINFVSTVLDTHIPSDRIYK